MRIAILVLLLSLAACARRPATLNLEPGTRLSLIPVAELPARTYIQDFEIINDKGVFRFSGLVEQEGNRLALVGLTPVGNRGFSVVWEGETATTERLPYYRLPLKAEVLLTVWQLMFLEPDDLKPHLAAAMIDLEVTGEQRFFRSDGQTLARAFSDDATNLIFQNRRNTLNIRVTTRAIEAY